MTHAVAIAFRFTDSKRILRERFIWLAIGVVLLVVLLASGRKPDLSVIDSTEMENA